METKRKKSDNHTLKKRVINIGTLIFLISGLLFIFINPIKGSVVQKMSQNVNILKVSASTVEKNESGPGNFDFDQVIDLTNQNIVRAFFNQRDIGQVGGISIPKVQLNLPIVKGVDNRSLAVGAGTMKEDQRMGVGNYALAGHNMNDGTTLFSPLYQVEIEDDIYLTDLVFMHKYRIESIETVDVERVDVIQDVEDSKLITLVTCNTDGSRRLIVQGSLEKTELIKDASDLEKIFGENK